MWKSVENPDDSYTYRVAGVQIAVHPPSRSEDTCVHRVSRGQGHSRGFASTQPAPPQKMLMLMYRFGFARMSSTSAAMLSAALFMFS